MNLPNKTIRILLIATSTGHELKFFRRKFQKFEEKHNVKVKIMRLSWTRAFPRLIEAFKNNNPPDVIQLGTTWVDTFASLGYLNPVPVSVFRPALTGWMNQACTYKEKYVAQPWFMEIRSLLVREDLLRKLNISSEVINSCNFINLCREIAEKQTRLQERILPFAFSVRPESELLHRVMSWHWAKGRSFPAPNKGGGGILSSSSCLKTLDFISKLLKVSSASPEELQRHPYKLYLGFLKGSYIFFQGSWEIRLTDSVNANDYGLMPMPVSGSGSKYWGGGSVLAVSSASRIKELSWQLVKFITSDEILESWVKLSCDIPAFSCDFWDKYSHVEGVGLAYSQVINSVSYPVHPLWASIEDELSTGLSNYFWKRFIGKDGQAELNCALKQADTRIDDMLKLYW
ncbi:MAG: extracellular solute-binding protein [Halanaerobiaceae bacterium]